ncbi:MAG: MBG domain-containing protein, partial [Candidatus Angelobacter sp.]
FSGNLTRVAGENVSGSPYAIQQGPLTAGTNYALTFNTANFAITPAPASVTPTAASKIYGTADPILSGTLSGFLATDNVTATYSRTAGETVLGSPYTISATLSPTGVLSNYNITYNTANFTITPAAASVTPTAASKIYGTADPVLSGTLSGFLAADNVTAIYSRTAGETVLGSPYTISATLSPTGVLSNYNITYNTASFTITPAAASVTPSAASKIYGTADPILSGTLSGFLAADNVTATYSRTAGETVLGGPYTISATLSPAGVLSNYNITYKTASFTITPAATTVTVNPVGAVTLGQTSLPVTAVVSAVAPSTALVNEGTVTFRILQGSTVMASANSATVLGGGASANLTVSALPVGSYTVQATFNPPTTGANFTGSSSTVGVSLAVQYNVCLLYDGTRSVKSGAAYPIKIYLCDVNNRDVSSAGIIVHAVSVSMLSGWSGPPEDAGNANPDMDFRYDSGQGPSGGYIFNLKTTGLGSGSYSLNFTAGPDAATIYKVPFGVK